MKNNAQLQSQISNLKRHNELLEKQLDFLRKEIAELKHNDDLFLKHCEDNQKLMFGWVKGVQDDIEEGFSQVKEQTDLIIETIKEIEGEGEEWKQ